ncbi:glutamate 5-kinase [Myxococcota bacterium]|nr:glutamate 5-kinase [Myxococcota bacterium]
MTARELLKSVAKNCRIVVKVGSGVLTDDHGRIDPKMIRKLTNDIAPLMGVRRWPVIVSSGAIAAGMGALGLKTRPKQMPGLQAAAAVGQSKLIEAWSQAFRKYEVPVAQVLLTHADLANRKRFLNARRALGELERRKAVAIINENDTVSFEEIAFGDNDQLAAQVSNLVDAQLLVMMSVASGILDDDGNRISVASAKDESIDALIKPTSSRFGKGGMASKLKAARAACARGAFVAILAGKAPGQLEALLRGEDVGTLLTPDNVEERLSSRTHWIAHTLRASGTIVIDPGAAKALQNNGKSLLPIGVLDVKGTFNEGDAVEIVEQKEDGPITFARGLVRYSADELRQILGRPSSAITEILGFTAGDTVVHRDDLVILGQ